MQRTLFGSAAALVVLLASCKPTAYGVTTGQRPLPDRAPGATYPNWEYLCFGDVDTGNISKLLVEAGSKGWELVGMTRLYLCFKRPRAVQGAAPAAHLAAPAARRPPPPARPAPPPARRPSPPEKRADPQPTPTD